MTGPASHRGETPPPDETPARPRIGPEADDLGDSRWRGESGGRHAAEDKTLPEYDDTARSPVPVAPPGPMVIPEQAAPVEPAPPVEPGAALPPAAPVDEVTPADEVSVAATDGPATVEPATVEPVDAEPAAAGPDTHDGSDDPEPISTEPSTTEPDATEPDATGGSAGAEPTTPDQGGNGGNGGAIGKAGAAADDVAEEDRAASPDEDERVGSTVGRATADPVGPRVSRVWEPRTPPPGYEPIRARRTAHEPELTPVSGYPDWTVRVGAVPVSPDGRPLTNPDAPHGRQRAVRDTVPIDVQPVGRPRRAEVPAAPADDEPFWMPVEEVPRADAEWPVPRAGSVHRSLLALGRTTPRQPRRTGPALVALVLLSLSAAFFGWVSAEPLWLAVGHGDRGTATVTRCTGGGIAQRCTGRFASASGPLAREVALLGVSKEQSRAGTTVTARMVDQDSRQAYVGEDDLALHLRWGLGLLSVLLCGAGIAWATGATRLESRPARRRALLGSMAGPLLLALGFLVASW